MITKSNSFKTSDGAMHATLDAAQRHSLKLLLNLHGEALAAGAENLTATEVAHANDMETISEVVVEKLLAHKDAVLAILNVKTRKPRATATPAKRTRRTSIPSPGTDANQQ